MRFARELLTYAILFGLSLYLMRQVRKPDRWFGWIFARLMNRSHDTLTDWGLQHVPISTHSRILDVGCGGGRTIEKLAVMASDGKIHGIDYAPGSVAVSSQHNSGLIADGRVVIQQASVSRIPFPDNSFDLVTAIETQYYWPDLPNDMREILRVLKPAGRLVVIAEMYKDGKNDWLMRFVMRPLGSSRLSVSDQRDLFSSAGYSNVEIFEEKKKSWICATAAKWREWVEENCWYEASARETLR